MRGIFLALNPVAIDILNAKDNCYPKDFRRQRQLIATQTETSSSRNQPVDSFFAYLNNH